jgi:MspA
MLSRLKGSFMFKVFLTCATAMLTMALSAGVAPAAPLATPDVSQYVQTVDGWTLRASLTDVTINSVPNMAGTPYSREGFVSGLATLTIEGNGAVPVKKADLQLWAQFGCQSDIRAGMNVQSGGLVPSLGSLSIVDFVGPILGGNLPVIGGQLEPTTPNPAITGTVQPGNIFRAKLAEKEMTDPNNTKVVHIQIRDTQVKVDGCGGAVAVRVVATGTLVTDTSEDWVNAYSDIVQV